MLEKEFEMETQKKIFKVASGDISVWEDPSGCICLKTTDKYGDPVEMSEEEALELAEILTRLASEM